MEAKEIMWRYLLANGSPIKKEGYYGDEIDMTVSRDVDVNMSKIDWKKTREPVTDLEEQFNGTFHPATTVSVLRGEAILKNGKKQLWKHELSNMEFGEVVRAILSVMEQ